MKKRILIVLSLMMIFGLFATVFAVSGTNTNAGKAESCPMQKNQTAQTIGTELSKVPIVVSDDDCCQPGADCCKGGSCCHKKKK